MGLDIYEVVLDVQEEFDIEISDSELQQIVSVGDLFDFTFKNLQSEHPERFVGNAKYDDEVWAKLQELLIVQLQL